MSKIWDNLNLYINCKYITIDNDIKKMYTIQEQMFVYYN